MASIMEEVTRLAALVSTMAAINGGGGGGGGGGRRRKQHGTDNDGNPLPKCPHCNKPATHKADECFSLAKNEEEEGCRIREWEVHEEEGGMTPAGALY